MSHLLEDKRKTRGLRMSTLVGEALEADEVFWGDNIWNEEDEDESFDEEEEEVKPDEFDSDFNETEDEDEDHSSNEGSVIKEKKVNDVAAVVLNPANSMKFNDILIVSSSKFKIFR
jgi:hypothetical protein